MLDLTCFLLFVNDNKCGLIIYLDSFHHNGNLQFYFFIHGYLPTHHIPERIAGQTLGIVPNSQKASILDSAIIANTLLSLPIPDII